MVASHVIIVTRWPKSSYIYVCVCVCLSLCASVCLCVFGF